MNIEKFKAQLVLPLRQTTLVFLRRNNQILLARKKRGFGMDYWNGVGGKVEVGESVEEAAIRETQEEINVTPQALQKRAVLTFYFPHQPLDKDFNQQVTVFLVQEWVGEPMESEEMIPEWFDLAAIPYAKMWSDDSLWLPQVLAGNFVEASFAFGPNQQVEESEVTTRPLN